MLRELERLQVRATFFLIAPRAIARPPLVRAMRDAGHALELHCWAHERHSLTPRRVVEAQTDQALDALDALGIAPRLWRAPWGDTAPWSADVATSRGLSLVGWTADTHDWRGDAAEAMLASVWSDLRPGGIVLMHDGIGPGARRTDCLQTLRLIAPLCRLARERGWAVDRLSPPAGAS